MRGGLRHYVIFIACLILGVGALTAISASSQALRDGLAVGHFYRVGNQTVAGSKGKIIPQVFIAAEVDLAGEMFMPRRGDEEVNMRRTVAVAA